MIGAATCSGTKRALQTREPPECFLTVTEVELYGECPNYELLLVYCLYCPTQVNAYSVVKVDTLYPAVMLSLRRVRPVLRQTLLTFL